MLQVRKAFLVAAVLLVASCGRESVNPAAPVDRVPGGSAASPTYGAVIPVTDAPGLYEQVDNPGNAGATILLAAGTYSLTRPLELQQDMSLKGDGGNRDSVIIDATGVAAGPGGAVRVGRGANSITTLTVEKATGPGAGIATDLLSELPARITISNVVVRTSRRGIDVRNGTPGRVLTASIVNSEIHHNTGALGQGIRIVNLAGATGGVISVSLSGNSVHDNRIGCFAGNNGVNSATIAVQSSNDTFEMNGVGCGVAAGVASANYNTVSFLAQSSIFRKNNTALLPTGITEATRAGFTVEGGSSLTANSTSFNTVSVVLLNPIFSDNAQKDLRAWGANNTTSGATEPAGTNNVASVVIVGAPGASTESFASVPPPPGTNTVSVVK